MLVPDPDEMNADPQPYTRLAALCHIHKISRRFFLETNQEQASRDEGNKRAGRRRN
jgi:hypothetical protein